MNKINTQARNSLLLGFAAIVWGISFVIQQIGGMALGAYTFNGTRMLIGAAAVYIAVLFLDKAGYTHKPKNKQEDKKLWLTGIACGIFLSVATNLQQVALNTGVAPGKAGFLTAVYILLVPILGLFIGRKCGWNIWIAVGVALVGLYFLCINGEFVLQFGDLLLLSCALGFSIQILIVDKFGKDVDGLRLSVIEFLVTGVSTMIIAVFTEIIPFDGGFVGWISQFASSKIWLSLLYMGLGSCGIGYTLQIIGQKDLNPTLASLIMSLESVFSVIAGFVFLKTEMTTREIIGCVLMFAAICLAQINFRKKTSKCD